MRVIKRVNRDPYRKKTNIIVISTITIFIIFYSLLPVLFLTDLYPEAASLLSNITIISSISILVGSYFLARVKSVEFAKKSISYTFALKFFLWIFFIFLFILVVTSEGIPIFAAFNGASDSEIAILREKFIKGREGWQSIFPYINSVLSGAVVPYLIVLAFPRQYKYRFHLAIMFFLYCVSFSEKAYFMKIALPLFFYYYSVAKNKRTIVVIWTVGLVTLLSLMTYLSNYEYEDRNSNAFFSLGFEPTTPLEKTAWRALVVPVITANDAIRTFQTNYKGIFFYGATSGFFASILGQERVRFEREVFGFQFGNGRASDDNTGSSNSFYVTEAYINFGMIGVILFGFITGRTLLVFSRTKDVALQGLSILFVYNLFNASLISTFLSQGYIFILLFTAFVKFK